MNAPLYFSTDYLYKKPPVADRCMYNGDRLVDESFTWGYVGRENRGARITKGMTAWSPRKRYLQRVCW